MSDLEGEEIIGMFYEKELEKINQLQFSVGKVIKRKGNEPYVKWNGYNSSFNFWIDIKNILQMRLFSRTEIIKWKNES